MPSDAERLAVVETENRTMRSDIAEIKESVKALEQIASRGGGAFHAILIIGGFLGWLAGIGATVYAAVHR